MDEVSEQTIAMRMMRALRTDIVTLVLKPGDIISESDMAARHGVSRQPVREAFIRLAQQGLLLIRPKRATVVKKISPDSVRQARFIRESIEVEIVRRVAGSVGAEAGPVLAGIIAAQEEAMERDDTLAFYERDDGFHHALARLAEVEYAWQLVDEHKMQLDRVRVLTLDKLAKETAVADHKAIIDRIVAGDAAGAEARMRQHLQRAELRLIRMMSAHPEFFE